MGQIGVFRAVIRGIKGGEFLSIEYGKLTESLNVVFL
jgi:hypothetical protein